MEARECCFPARAGRIKERRGKTEGTGGGNRTSGRRTNRSGSLIAVILGDGGNEKNSSIAAPLLSVETGNAEGRPVPFLEKEIRHLEAKKIKKDGRKSIFVPLGVPVVQRKKEEVLNTEIRADWAYSNSVVVAPHRRNLLRKNKKKRFRRGSGGETLASGKREKSCAKTFK